jgi:hypothetical protein
LSGFPRRWTICDTEQNSAAQATQHNAALRYYMLLPMPRKRKCKTKLQSIIIR